MGSIIFCSMKKDDSIKTSEPEQGGCDYHCQTSNDGAFLQ